MATTAGKKSVSKKKPSKNSVTNFNGQDKSIEFWISDAAGSIRGAKDAPKFKDFNEGLRNEAQKQTEIGLVPESWEAVELVTLLREPLRNGYSAKATTNENGIRTLTLTAVTQREFSMKSTRVTCADAERVKNMWLKSDDIFAERANTAEYVGLAALYEGEEDFANFPDRLICVQVDTARFAPKILIEGLLAEPCRRYYKKNARSTAGNFLKIDQGTVEKTLVLVPLLTEQAELEMSFRTLDEKWINTQSERPPSKISSALFFTN